MTPLNLVELDYQARKAREVILNVTEDEHGLVVIRDRDMQKILEVLYKIPLLISAIEDLRIQLPKKKV